MLIRNLSTGLPYLFGSFHTDTASPERFIDTAYHGIAAAKPRSFFSRKKPDPPLTSHIMVPKTEHSLPPNSRIGLETSLQYGRATGLPALVDFVREFTFRHVLQGGLGYDETAADVVLTCGNTNGFSKAIGAIGKRGDTILVEEFTFPAPLKMAGPFGIATAPVKLENGVMAVEGPGGLRYVLENWDPARGRRPHFMYTVTIGQNPAGGTLNRQRRREIYALCERFDIIIIEDDPYWHLQYTEPSQQMKNDVEYPFLAALEKSYLAIDVSGRVIRFDTFSKPIAPGCRCRLDHGSKAVRRGDYCGHGNKYSAAQRLCSEHGNRATVPVLGNVWMGGMARVAAGVYEQRMRLMAGALEADKQIVTIASASSDLDIVSKTNVYSFTVPDGGMFIWMHIHINKHPEYQAFLDRGNTKAQVMAKLWEWVAITQKSLPSPGGILPAMKRVFLTPASACASALRRWSSVRCRMRPRGGLRVHTLSGIWLGVKSRRLGWMQRWFKKGGGGGRWV